MLTVYIVFNTDTGVEVGAFLEEKEALYLRDELGSRTHHVAAHNEGTENDMG